MKTVRVTPVTHERLMKAADGRPLGRMVARLLDEHERRTVEKSR